MIDFGDGWTAESDRVFHWCGPDVRALFRGAAMRCECGAEIPQIVQRFFDWLAEPSVAEADR